MSLSKSRLDNSLSLYDFRMNEVMDDNNYKPGKVTPFHSLLTFRLVVGAAVLFIMVIYLTYTCIAEGHLMKTLPAIVILAIITILIGLAGYGTMSGYNAKIAETVRNFRTTESLFAGLNEANLSYTQEEAQYIGNLLYQYQNLYKVCYNKDADPNIYYSHLDKINAGIRAVSENHDVMLKAY